MLVFIRNLLLLPLMCSFQYSKISRLSFLWEHVVNVFLISANLNLLAKANKENLQNVMEHNYISDSICLLIFSFFGSLAWTLTNIIKLTKTAFYVQPLFQWLCSFLFQLRCRCSVVVAGFLKNPWFIENKRKVLVLVSLVMKFKNNQNIQSFTLVCNQIKLQTRHRRLCLAELLWAQCKKNCFQIYLTHLTYPNHPAWQSLSPWWFRRKCNIRLP